jgi:hypothetical protein
MKTMTCKQLFGPCDELIHGETAEEMMKNSQNHGMEMVAKGDQSHIDAMNEMKKNMNPESMGKMMAEFNKNFEELKEDK